MTSSILFQVAGGSAEFQILEIHLTGNGLITPEDLKGIVLPSGIDFRKGVILSGKAPVWLYAFLSHELHIAKWVATFDPRIGAVVVQSHDVNSPQKGDIIPSEEIIPLITKEEKSSSGPAGKPAREESKAVCIVGPANSGKSVFLRELCKALNKTLGEEFRTNFFLIRACPDGEGDWFGDLHPDEGILFRVKKAFDDEFAQKISEDIRNMKKNKRVTLIDCGGRIDKRNQTILNACTETIIVSSSNEEMLKWEGAALASNLKIIVKILSVDYNSSEQLSENYFKIGKMFRDNANILIPKPLLQLVLN